MPMIFQYQELFTNVTQMKELIGDSKVDAQTAELLAAAEADLKTKDDELNRFRQEALQAQHDLATRTEQMVRGREGKVFVLN